MTPPARPTSNQMLDGWHRLRTDQPDLFAPEIAEQIGVGHDQLRGVVQRARTRDDPRAVPGRDAQFRSDNQPRPIPFDPCPLDEGESA